MGNLHTQELDLMDALTLDFRFVETRYELRALRAHLELVESNLSMLQELEVSSAWQELRNEGLEDDEAEVHFKMDEVEERVRRIYPRYFRGSFLLMLVAVLELGLEEVANCVGERGGLEYEAFRKFQQRERGSFLEALERYYTERLRQSLRIDDDQREQLRLLYQVRHRLAHSNGRANRLRHWDLFDDWQRRRVGITVASGGNLDFSNEYVQNSYSLVQDCLRQVMEDATGSEIEI